MKTTRIAILVALAFLAAPGADAANPSTRQWIVTTAKVTGAGGEQFVTSLRIANPNGGTATVQMTFLPQSPLDGTGAATGDNSGRSPISLTVAGRNTRAIEDVIGTQFSSAGTAGGILVTSDVPVVVLSQTLNVAARSQSGISGTFGFSIPAQVTDETVSVGDTAYLPFMASASSTSSGFRTNVFLQNTVTETSVVNFKLQKGDGTVLGERDYTLGKRSQTQLNRLGDAFGYTQADTNLTLLVTVKSGGPVAVGASVIDNAIGSINYVPPTKAFLPNQGAFGVVFPDDLYGFSGRLDVKNALPSYFSAGVVLTGCPDADPPGTGTLFFMQAFGPEGGTLKNTDFTKNADGSYNFTGGTTTATWSGVITNNPDGTLGGVLTYARKTGAGVSCSGRSIQLTINGARALGL